MQIYNSFIILTSFFMFKPNNAFIRSNYRHISSSSYFQKHFSQKQQQQQEKLYQQYNPTPTTTKYQPKTPKQEQYVNYLTNPNISLVVAVGPAGTGKTLFACKSAIEKLKKKQIEKIILTRPLVSVADENIGFLPGNLNKKMELWVQPMIDVFTEYFSTKEIKNYIETGVIEITPLLYMRGRTFKNTIIIADEIQNTTPSQLMMLLTRCGDGSKIIVMGDPKQSDLKEKNGLVDFTERYKSYIPPITTTNTTASLLDNIQIVELEKSDIQRSNLVRQVLELYSKNTPPSLQTIASSNTQKYNSMYDLYNPL